ncbi:FAD-dependent oxidoreductase [Sinomicrobium sp. FJxs]|uniref:FAD-dependent oxidoreductase n=1 Tax=Sinomicrobium weinanense TaxID=2842200 RepID=A0A926JPJ1_9FLAO|nr:FAD-dependent oxidoreductase [Sinomicrobium weinanense]MBU3125185.1 FAD-dependent oxidoreductase [Sinomicrobium weinanense]
MKDVIVIGGGVIGLCSAYYLAGEGHRVTVLDSSDMTDGCSFGNAGLVVPSHIIPLAQPGMIAQGIRWMFNPKSPFYVRPRLHKALLSWSWQFYRNSTREHVEKAMPALRDLSLLSKELYRDLARKDNAFFYDEKGLLMLYKTEKTGEEERHVAKEAEKLGLEVDFLSGEEVRELETGVDTNVLGGVHYRSDAHLYPNKFMAFIRDEVLKLGVELKRNTKVSDFQVKGGEISEVLTDQGNFKADEFVLASGAWSAGIANKLNLKLPLLPGKGYSFTLRNRKEKPLHPAILCEGKVSVTPMGDDLRFGGTMEITHTGDTRIRTNRLQGIVDTIRDFYPGFELELPEKKNTWYGFRPCTSSGLPVISGTEKISNLVIATGHAMMGVSLAPATGKLVSEMLSGKKTSVDTNMFRIAP